MEANLTQLPMLVACYLNHSATDLETLGVVWALCHFRAYLLKHICTVYTDHASLKASLMAKYSSGHSCSHHSHYKKD